MGRKTILINDFDYEILLSKEEGKVFDELPPAYRTDEDHISFHYFHSMSLGIKKEHLEGIFQQDDLLFTLAGLFGSTGRAKDRAKQTLEWCKKRMDEGTVIMFDSGAFSNFNKPDSMPFEKYLEACREFTEILFHENARLVAYDDMKSRPNTVRLWGKAKEHIDTTKVMPVDHMYLDYHHQQADFDEIYKQADIIGLSSAGRGAGFARKHWERSWDRCLQFDTKWHGLGLGNITSGPTFAHEGLKKIYSVDTSSADTLKQYGNTVLCIKQKVGDLILPKMKGYELCNMNARPLALRGAGRRMMMNSVQRDYWRRLTARIADKTGIELNKTASFATALVVVHEVRKYMEMLSEFTYDDFIGNWDQLRKAEEVNRVSVSVPEGFTSTQSFHIVGTQTNLPSLPSLILKAEDDPKTPAKPSERLSGSEQNDAGSASSEDNDIKFSPAIISALEAKVEEHNEKHTGKGQKVTLGMLKAVFRRGAGAFSSSHRPSVTSRSQWAFARVNAFLKLVATGERKATYTTDLDLLPKGHEQRSEKSLDEVSKASIYVFPVSKALPQAREGEVNFLSCHKGADWGEYHSFIEANEAVFDFVLPAVADHPQVSEMLLTKAIELAGDKVIPVVDAGLNNIAESLEDSAVKAVALDFSTCARSSVRSDIKKVCVAKGIDVIALNPSSLDTLHTDLCVKAIITEADRVLALNGATLQLKEQGDDAVLTISSHPLSPLPFDRVSKHIGYDEALHISRVNVEMFNEVSRFKSAEILTPQDRQALFDSPMRLNAPSVEVSSGDADWARSLSFPSLKGEVIKGLAGAEVTHVYDGTADGLAYLLELSKADADLPLSMPSPTDRLDSDDLLALHDTLHKMEHSVLIQRKVGEWDWDRLVETHSALVDRLTEVGLIHPPKEHSPLDETSTSFSEEMQVEEVSSKSLNDLDDKSILEGLGDPSLMPQWAKSNLGSDRVDSLGAQWAQLTPKERQSIEKARAPKQLQFRFNGEGSWALHSVHQGNRSELALTVKESKGDCVCLTFPLPPSSEVITSVSRAKQYLSNQGIDNPLSSLEFLMAKDLGRAVPKAFMKLHGVTNAFGYGGKDGAPSVFNLISSGTAVDGPLDRELGFSATLKGDGQAYEVICRKVRASAEVIDSKEVLREHFMNPNLQGIVDNLPHVKKSRSSFYLAFIKEGGPVEEQVETNKRFIEITKADHERRTVMGIVLEPEVADAQGDIYSEEVIRESAYNFLNGFNKSTELGVMHKSFGDVGLSLVESYITPVEMSVNDRTIRQGAWLMTMRVDDDSLWEGVKAGKLTGFSIGGVANSVSISQP